MKIVAEVGCNWHTIEEAKLFIDKSKELGLFSTKFQIYNDDVIKDSEHYDFLKSIQLDYEKAKELFDYGKSIGQEVFFTPMFEDAIFWMSEIGCEFYKIRYKDRFNGDFISLINTLVYNPIIFRSCDYDSFIIGERIIPFLCIPKYPAKWSDYIDNLYYESIMKVLFKGISSHIPDCQLLYYIMKNYKEIEYFEKHVKLNDDCLESKWSVTFEQLAEVLNK
ncbi:MAG: N-acetylneuraminate synthase family protein [Candidatus Thorarchaeota archaeon]